MDGHRFANRWSRRERAGAVLLSVLLHLAFFLSVFATAAGVVPQGASDPFAEGEAFEVSLIGSEGAPGHRETGDKADADAASLEILARRLRAEQSDLVVGQSEQSGRQGSVAQLFEAIGRIRAPGQRGVGSSSSGAAAGQDATTASADRTGMPVLDDGSRGLWGQVEPCWRRIPGRSKVLVTLEVTLNREGKLDRPPRIVRPSSGRPDEARLVAEAQAMAAIQACLPYRASGPFARQRTFRLTFAAVELPKAR